MNFIKQYKIVLLSLLIILSFLSIQINYNGMYSNSIFRCLLAISSNKWDFSAHDITMNFTYNLLEVLVLTVILVLSAVFRKIKFMTTAIVLFMLLWLFWAFSYKGLIIISIYVISSIPFLLISLASLYILMNSLYKRTKVKSK